MAIPAAQAVRRLLAHRFPKARFNVTVGRRLFWDGTTLAALRASGQDDFEPVATRAEDPAAIIFTTGSTGPPKGVLYQHGNFEAQVEQLGQAFRIAPGEVDLAGFPLFGLFNGALGVTTVVPVMDPTRPAKVVPKKFLAAIRDWRVTQSFGSPAIWNRIALGLRTDRPADRIARAGHLGRSTGAGPRAGADEKLPARRGRNPHPLRRHRGLARRLDHGQRNPGRDAGSNAAGSGRLRRATFFRHSLAGDPHRRWPDRHPGRRRAVARRANRRADRHRARW